MKIVRRLKAAEWLALLAMSGLIAWLVYESFHTDFQSRKGTQDGQQDAEADMAANDLKLLFGRPPYYAEQLKAIFQERYKLTLEYAGDLGHSAYGQAYKRAYNFRVEQAVQSRIPDFSIQSDYGSACSDARNRYDAELQTHQQARGQ